MSSVDREAGEPGLGPEGGHNPPCPGPRTGTNLLTGWSGLSRLATRPWELSPAFTEHLLDVSYCVSLGEQRSEMQAWFQRQKNKC